jgi:hypothetical protein
LASSITIALLLLFAGCGEQSSAAESSPPEARLPEAEQVVVIIDLSTSITESDRDRFQQVLTALVDRLAFGDMLVALVAHEAGRQGETPTRIFEIPTARNPMRPSSGETTAMVAARNYAHASIRELLGGEAVPGTDLFASLHTAADYMHGAGERHRTLVILSDMLQCTAEGCMEPPRPPFARALVESQAATGVLPDLARACVMAIGADPSTKHGVGVRAFWQEYFAATGAEFSTDHYRQIIPRIDLLRCGKVDEPA